MKIAFALALLVLTVISSVSVFADVTNVTSDAYLSPDAAPPMNGDNIVLIITVLCLSAVALVVLLVTSVIIKRKK